MTRSEIINLDMAICEFLNVKSSKLYSSNDTTIKKMRKAASEDDFMKVHHLAFEMKGD